MAYQPKDSDMTHAHFDGVLIDIILKEVQEDELPAEDIPVPEWELPANDQDGELVGESIKEKEEKWTDLRISKIR